MKDQKNITNNNQRLAKCVRSLVKVFFYFIDCAEKIIGVFSSRRPRKHLHVRSRLYVPHSQPASQPVQNGAQCLRNQSIKPLRVISLTTTRLVCVPPRRTQLYDEATFSLKNRRLHINMYTVRFHANGIEIKVFDFKVIDSAVIKCFNCVYNYQIYNLAETKRNKILAEQTNFETQCVWFYTK